MSKTGDHGHVIVLCGVVGSGKTFFSTALCSLKDDWHRISQDDLGSRPACEQVTKEHLEKGHNVIIDRCNFDKRQRVMWIKMAHDWKSRVVALELKTPPETCRRRIMNRQEHPTGVTGNRYPSKSLRCGIADRSRVRTDDSNSCRRLLIRDRQFGTEILDSFIRDYKSPTLQEGFAQLYTIKMTEDILWTESMIDIVLERLGIESPGNKSTS